MLVDPKGSGKPPVFSGKEEHFYVWTKKVENYVSGVFPNVRGALAFAAESQDVVTAATVATGVPELGVQTSAEIDGQLFVVLSALKASTLSCQQEVTMASRVGASCTVGGTRTQGTSTKSLRHRDDGRSRETLLEPTRCSRKRTQSCGRHSHEFP